MTAKTHGRFWKTSTPCHRRFKNSRPRNTHFGPRDTFHPSLRFEERRNGICVARIGEHHRTLGIRDSEIVAWFWITTEPGAPADSFSYRQITWFPSGGEEPNSFQPSVFQDFSFWLSVRC